MKRNSDVTDYINTADAAMRAAAEHEHDFGGWLADILARAAAELGSTEALTSGRPGSWEADLVQRLVEGPVGWSDDYLTDYRRDTL